MKTRALGVETSCLGQAQRPRVQVIDSNLRSQIGGHKSEAGGIGRPRDAFYDAFGGVFRVCGVDVED